MMLNIDDIRNTVICGDCLEVMRQMPDKCVDLVLTDPPYNISKKNNFATMERYNQYKGMYFGDWDKDFNQTTWLEQMAVKMKIPSSVVVFNSWQNLKLISDKMETLGLSVKRVLVIRKTNPMPINRDRLFTNSFEFAIWATKGTRWTFNRRGEYETGLFECKNNGETEHPTEKQICTTEELIGILSNPGDTILDPFLGSGTTAVACYRTRRDFIGVEISPEYCEIARKRLQAEKDKLALFEGIL